MANNWFQFKQFRIQQDACAMKVTTDACLFGAWLADKLKASATPMHALDIGTGTGLLSLMMAQQHANLYIDAVELEAAAATQAAENVFASNFAHQINVHHADFFDISFNKTFDLIWSNPPFHQQQLKANHAAKNVAHHEDGMTIAQLLPKVVELLNPHGWLALLLPYYRQQEVLDAAAKHGLYATEICAVKQSNRHDCFRSMLLFGKQTTELPSQLLLHICDELPHYSQTFNQLLQPYYLKL
jgi:tRNA1Val (adenine37-N6)-methyltransferase